MIRLEKGKYANLIRWIWISFFSGLVFIFLFIWAISIDFLGLFGGMPSLKALENPKSEQASELYTADGKLMGKYFTVDRQPIDFEEISPYVINALIATEDVRFEQHAGIDAKAIGRVLFRMGGAGGGSTLTQQLAKNLFDTRAKDNRGALSKTPYIGLAIIKFKEWITAVRLERSYTKKEIITMYLNECEFGHNAFGIQAAAKTYFNKNASELDLGESAMLVGMLQAPSKYDPINPQKQSAAIERRNIVLGQLKTYKFITEDDFQKTKKEPLRINFHPQDNSEGIAPYFRNEAFKEVIQWAIKKGYAKNEKEAKEFIYTAGLRVYTTIDSRLQKLAEDAMQQHMKEKQRRFYAHWKAIGRDPWVDDYGREKVGYIEQNARRTLLYSRLKAKYGKDEVAIFNEMNKPKQMRVFTWQGEKDTLMSPMDSIRHYKHFLQTGMMSIEPKTGHIKAWVGGINYRHFQYDQVRQAKHQPGSTFKPIVYATAVDAGYTPCHKMPDVPVVFPGWIPKQDGGYSGGMYPLRKAMGYSINTIAAGLTKDIGVDGIIRYAKEMGVETELPRVASICLGSHAMSMYDLLGAYTIFPNRGYRNQTMMITKITDKNGKVLEEFAPEVKEVMSERKAYMMLDMLMAGTERGGTSAALHGYPILFANRNQIGGKTGTTQNQADALYVGVTQDLITGVWVGGDDKAVRFLSMFEGQGAVLALPAFAIFMQKVYADGSLPYKQRPFEKPGDLDMDELNCELMDAKVERVGDERRKKKRR
ncbi:MAG: transglycosylase domain-containing protein [Thermonemataceae bacterium]|nr:transglycosylase domain-containing protein [Thermonemataceae bacterium]